MKILFGLFLLGAAFGGAYYAGKTHADICTFRPTEYPAVNHAFTVVIIGHNNGSTLERTLRSVFSQNYSNYRVVYVDDGSDDGSYDLARDLIGEGELVRNEERLGVLANLSRVARQCRDDEIIVVAGGEDWLAHEWVLARLNQYYANPNLWLGLGQYRQYPEYLMPSHVFPSLEKPLREQTFTTSYLKTFYASLFKQISEGDFQNEESYLPAASDLAYILPMLEMAGEHTAYIPEVLYIVNKRAEDLASLVQSEQIIRSMAAYEPLAKLELYGD